MIDIIIIIIAIIYLIRGWNIGFVRQFLSTVGFFGGLLLGAYLEKYTVIYGHSSITRSIIGLITTIGMALIMLTIFEYIGLALKRRLVLIKINSIDSLLGSFMSLISILLGIWLGASLLNSLQSPQILQVLDKSKIISYLNHQLPPAPTIIADLGHIIDPNGFPKVFINGEPIINTTTKLPTLQSIQTAVSKDKNSVVKIVGQGCGGIVEGSGFIVAPNLIMTNAHVVAGIPHPYVTTLSGQTFSASPIWFNPNLDLAILKVNDLPGPILTLAESTYSTNTPGAVLGYPGGGSFTAVVASIINQLSATGQNIYGTGNITRSIYEINANVIPGNSGGPLINLKGQVMGVVFAQSTSYANVGYALISNQVTQQLTQAENNNHLIGTGSCAK